MQIEKIKKSIILVLPKYGIKRAAFFGSLARGEAVAKSDVDLLVEFGTESSLLDLVGLKLELQVLLKRKVDVVTYKSLHPLLKDRILREQVPIYGKGS